MSAGLAASRLTFADLRWFAARPRTEGAWIDVFRFQVDSFAGRYRALGTLLDPVERGQLLRLRDPGERRRSSIARGILRRVLGAYLGVPPDTVPLCRDARGKPYIVQSASVPPLHVSCTHAGDVSAFVVAAGASAGIDIEPVTTSRFAERIVPVMLSVRERTAWATVPRRDQARWLARTWVRKEALLKADGSGLAIDPISIDAAPPPRSEGTDGYAEPGALGGWVLFEVSVADGYVGAVAAHGARPVLTLATLVDHA